MIAGSEAAMKRYLSCWSGALLFLGLLGGCSKAPTIPEDWRGTYTSEDGEKTMTVSATGMSVKDATKNNTNAITNEQTLFVIMKPTHRNESTILANVR